MLTIRMQRTGRKGHAMFRVVVQDSRVTPTSGKIVAQLGSYDPHAKVTTLDKDKASFYLTHGAQPSDRAVRILQAEGVDLPSWVTIAGTKSRNVRNADKRRSTTPAVAVEEAEPAEAETPAVPEETAETPEVTEPSTEEESVAETVPEEPVPEDVTVEESPDEPVETDEAAAPETSEN